MSGGKTYWSTIDANGNLLNDGTKSFKWDAQNRLIQVNILNPQPPGTADTVQMSYDGGDRRVGITELHSGTVLVAKTFVWCGSGLCQERDSSGGTVVKRFFTQGEQISGINYYYTRDHLGSVREMTDSSGTVQAEYGYDAWGRQTQLGGTLCSDFGYTGFYKEGAVRLNLTLFRAYDPEKGRWLSRDPLSERAGLNLYEYVKNNTFSYIDSTGLCGNCLNDCLDQALKDLGTFLVMTLGIADIGISLLVAGCLLTGPLAGVCAAGVLEAFAGPEIVIIFAAAYSYVQARNNCHQKCGQGN